MSDESSGEALLARARDAAARGEWQQAYEGLIETDARSPLSAPDLALLADMAYAAGHFDVTIATWERAYRQSMQGDDRLAAAGAAVRVAMHLLFDTALMAPVRAWAKRVEQNLEGVDGVTPVHAWLAVVRNYERLLSGDFQEARQWARRAIDTGEKCAPAAAAIGRVAEARSLILEGDVAQGLGLLNEAALAAVSGELDPLSTGIVIAKSCARCRRSRNMTWPRSGPKRWSGGGKDSLWGASTGAAGFTGPRSCGCEGRGWKQRRKRFWPATSSGPTCAGNSGGR